MSGIVNHGCHSDDEDSGPYYVYRFKVIINIHILIHIVRLHDYVNKNDNYMACLDKWE